MNKALCDNLAGVGDDGVGAIRRRHVIYVEGYDPRGAKGYFELFRRTCDRFQHLWPASVTLRPVEIDSEDFAHWSLDLRGPNWLATTHYDFLRLENFIRADMARPMLVRGLCWFVGDILSGVEFRIFWASWRFVVHLLCFQLLLVAWLAVAVIFGFTAGHLAATFLAFSMPAATGVSLLAPIGALWGLRPLAERWRAIQISSCWTVLRRFGRGRPTWLDHVIEVGARKVVAAARAQEVDELALVGHSTGCVIASAIMARALELNPELDRGGPSLVLLTLGSVMPAVALHPAARRMRNIVERLAVAPNLAWIDCQSRKDVMCFANFDPVDGIGVRIGAQRRNPLLWRIRFRDMISPEDYGRFRRNYFRMHYQYIMAGDRPAPYDFIWLVAGPTAMTEWPKRGRDLIVALSREAAPSNANRNAPEKASY